MKIRQKLIPHCINNGEFSARYLYNSVLAAVLAALLLTLHIIPALAAQAQRLPQKRPAARGLAASSSEAAALPKPGMASASDITAPPPELPKEPEETNEPDTPLPGEAPVFRATLESTFEGYVVRGHFTEFPPDISRIQPLCSLDGETWRECGVEWDLRRLGDKDPGSLALLENQICLYSSFEPLKSYLAGTVDRFSLKLRLTLKNGAAYESTEAVIERGGVRPLPDGITLSARFAPSVRVLQRRPFRYYGQYQLTVSADAAPEEAAVHLPDTLPVEILLLKDENSASVAEGIVDCPIAWKPLSFPRLAAGESVTIPDAAEAIIVPAGAILDTPLGVFRLDEPLAVGDEFLTDEVRLILNAAPKDGNPAGALSDEAYGLEMAFYLKPTGATAIRAYIWTESDPQWTELPGLSLTEAAEAPHSGANSSYAVILRNDQEPYRSYLEAKAAGETPEPFLVGLKIEGGVFDGRQLVLAWPDAYDIPAKLPQIGGSGGNEGNAGSGNTGDSTEGGQRPDLPHAPEENGEQEETPGTPLTPGGEEAGDKEETPPGTSQIPGGKEDEAQPDAPQEDKKEETKPGAPQAPGPGIAGDNDDRPTDAPPVTLSHSSGHRQSGGKRQTAGPAGPEETDSGQRPYLPPEPEETADRTEETTDMPQETPDTPQETPDTPAGGNARENRGRQDNGRVPAAPDSPETQAAYRAHGAAEAADPPDASEAAAQPAQAAAGVMEKEHPPAAQPEGGGPLTGPDSRPSQANGAAAAGLCIAAAAAWTAARHSSGRFAGVIRNALRRLILRK